jgi:nicotinate-nucleotide adenylyltransferase
MSARRTIAVFGGSFNPPHLAHQMACLVVLETAPIDELWMVPTWRHPFDKELCAFEHRVAMCELAASVFGDRVKVSRIEEELGGPGQAPSRTLHTLEALRARWPGDALRLVIGADILSETDKWHRWDQVVRLAPPLVIGRTGYGSDAEIVLPAVSSTDVRARLRRGQDVVPLVSRAVMDYIAGRGLYR